MISFRQLVQIFNGSVQQMESDEAITSLLTDSRNPIISPGSVFFAIKGERHDGHDFVADLHRQGILNFIVERQVDLPVNANILIVDSSLRALQRLAEYHRNQFSIPVIGITGSNGKTIVKEWLYKMLSLYKTVVKSPRSYNSQLGVPLSVWQINREHEIAIFEAGISTYGEMENLETIIKPSLGIFTNLGSAHDEGFSSIKEKLAEKVKLFKDSEVVVCRSEHAAVEEILKDKALTWGLKPRSTIQLHTFDSGQVELNFKDQRFEFHLPFQDPISMENAMHCIAIMLYLGFDQSQIQLGLNGLTGIAMRLEMKKGVNGCYLIDDSYNNDLAGLRSALDFLKNSVKTENKSIVLSDIFQSGLSDELLYQKVADLLSSSEVKNIIGVGTQLKLFSHLFPTNARFFKTTEDLLQYQPTFSNETILIKGARAFHFERIVRQYEELTHGTRLEIDLNALTHNLNYYRSKLKDGTKLMVMVKAFGYGTGSYEVASLLEYHRVDYIGVAYSDEGVSLRKLGISLPIMVMNPSPESIMKILEHRLEPEIYSLSMLKNVLNRIGIKPLGVHLKIETGMNRLGFEEKDLSELIQLFRANPNLEVKSIFSHLAGADSPKHDSFSTQQWNEFNRLSERVMKDLDIAPLRHILNSSGIVRYPKYQLDMVRLGVGLYGVEANNLEQDQLRSVSSLKTVVSQIKRVKKGQTIGYDRAGQATSDLAVATIAIGYADGFSRAFSNGVGEVWIKGNRAAVIGNVCMDMTMIDVTDLDVKEGDEVEVFGAHISIQELAANIGTIPYEILTNVSQRVKRLYYSE